MKRSSTVFLQSIVVLIGIAVLVFLLWEPHLEGRNARATPFAIYFADPFLAYVYVASVPFFLALYQAFKVLGYAGRNQVFTPAAVSALRTIKCCAMVTIGFVAVSAFYLPSADDDDRPAGITMRVLTVFLATIVATVAAMLERILQSAVDLKSENDLTV